MLRPEDCALESLGECLQTGIRTLVALCPGEAEFTLPSLPGVSVLLPADYLQAYGVTGPVSSTGPIPYHAQFFTALGTVVLRRLQSWSRPPCKVVVVDWDSV